VRKLLRRSQGGAALLNVQDASGYTALMTAAEHGREEIVRLLIQWDACSAVARNKLNHTAIELADWCGHRGVCLALEARMAAAGQLSAQTQALLAAQQLQRAAMAAAAAAVSVCGPGAVGGGAGSGGGGGRDSATGSSGSHASSPVGAGQRASNSQSPHAGGLVGGMASLGMGEGGAADASLVSLSAHFARILFVTQACLTNLPFLHILYYLVTYSERALQAALRPRQMEAAANVQAGRGARDSAPLPRSKILFRARQHRGAPQIQVETRGILLTRETRKSPFTSTRRRAQWGRT